MITFTYTKPNGEVSFRKAVVISKPNPNYSMLDLSSIDEEELPSIIETVKAYEKERNSLLEKYDLKRFYKNFKPNCITEVKGLSV